MDFTPLNWPDHPAVNRYAKLVNEQCKAASPPVPPCFIGALILRESSGDPNAHSFDGGWGLTQITAGVDDNGVHTASGMKMLDPDSNIYVCVNYFVKGLIESAQKMHESYGKEMDAINPEILYFVACGYNAGFGTVQAAVSAGHDPDKFTTDLYGHGVMENYHDALAASKKAGG